MTRRNLDKDFKKSAVRLRRAFSVPILVFGRWEQEAEILATESTEVTEFLKPDQESLKELVASFYLVGEVNYCCGEK